MRMTFRQRDRLVEVRRIDDGITGRGARCVPTDAFARTERCAAVGDLVSNPTEPSHPRVHDSLALFGALRRVAAEVQKEKLRHDVSSQGQAAYRSSRVAASHARVIVVDPGSVRGYSAVAIRWGSALTSRQKIASAIAP